MINIQTLTQKVLSGETISYETGVELIHHPEKKELYDAADTIRKHFCGNKMDLCSITNAKSGACSENCKWCSQSAHHTTDIENYELIDKEKAVAEASENAKNGVHRHSLVTSGRSISDTNLQDLLSIYKEIKQTSSIGLCASMG
ncbi:MAG: biotin synthase BioB, partial [Bacteroidales bacterium]